MGLRYFNCTVCEIPYDRNTGKSFSALSNSNFIVRGTCNNCFTQQRPLVEEIPKKPVIRECRDVAWANSK